MRAEHAGVCGVPSLFRIAFPYAILCNLQRLASNQMNIYQPVHVNVDSQTRLACIIFQFFYHDSILYIKTRPTPTTTLGPGITHDLELAPNQLRRKIYGTALQQLQARLVHDHLRPCVLFF